MLWYLENMPLEDPHLHQEIFDHARVILEAMNAKPTLAELRNLRNIYVAETLKDLTRVEHEWNAFRPSEEAAARFLFYEHGIVLPATVRAVARQIGRAYPGATKIAYVENLVP